MKFKGVIFDLDGVICFTDEFHYLAWKTVAEELGIEFNRTINNRLLGLSRMDSLEIVLEKSPVSYSAEEKEAIATKKNDLYKVYLNQMSEEDLSDEVRKTLQGLRKKGLLLAVGSSSRNTPVILEKLGLADFFDAVADGNIISRSKPDPEVFLKAAEFLALDPADCLVVEDALSGTQAGHAGNFRVACLGVASAAGVGDYNMKSIGELLDLVE